MEEKLLEIVNVLELNNIDYCIFGGTAALAYGATRNITDIDLWTPLTNIDRIKELFPQGEKVSFNGLAIGDIEIWTESLYFANNNKVICFHFDNSMKSRVKQIEMFNKKLNFISIEDLIIIKCIMQRGKSENKYDLEDIREIIFNDIDYDYFDMRAKKCNTEERIYEVLNRIKNNKFDETKKVQYDFLFNYIDDFYKHKREIGIKPSIDKNDIIQEIKKYNFEEPLQINNIISESYHMLKEGILQNSSPLCFGWFNPPTFWESILADILVKAFNPQLASIEQSPYANYLEKHLLKFFGNFFGFNKIDSGADSGTFTNGATESNLMAIFLALNKNNQQYSMQGSCEDNKRKIIYLSSEAHHSFEKNCAVLGLGKNSIRWIETDDKGKMCISDLTSKIKEDKEHNLEPLMVVGTMGTTNIGSIDPLKEISDICIQENIWFHIDAAWGGAICLNEKYSKEFLKIKHIDSLSFDAHKWLCMPMNTGMFFSKHKSILVKSFAISADYTVDDDEQYVQSFLWSRRFFGLSIFFPLATKGINYFSDMIENQITLGNNLRKLLSINNWKVLNDTFLPIVCFEINDSMKNKTEIQQKIYDRILNKNKVWLAKTSINKVFAFRACITNYETSKEDIETLVRELNEARSAIYEEYNI